ncbi:hypothetical protein [Nocardia sp. NBC_01388]|uniref:hypothetical protein n=1 Tax=Nocardia sp. NBC_01388 TaxID=2903596 RepID=UPI003864F260
MTGHVVFMTRACGRFPVHRPHAVPSLLAVLRGHGCAWPRSVLFVPGAAMFLPAVLPHCMFPVFCGHDFAGSGRPGRVPAMMAFVLAVVVFGSVLEFLTGLLGIAGQVPLVAVLSVSVAMSRTAVALAIVDRLLRRCRRSDHSVV